MASGLLKKKEHMLGRRKRDRAESRAGRWRGDRQEGRDGPASGQQRLPVHREPASMGARPREAMGPRGSLCWGSEPSLVGRGLCSFGKPDGHISRAEGSCDQLHGSSEKGCEQRDTLPASSQDKER